MSTLSHGLCPLCEAGCGIEVETEGDRILKIRGDEHDPFSRGYVCPKAVALKDVQSDPNRVRRPLRRQGARWQEVGWDEALDEISQRLSAIQRAHGKDAVGLYLGNPTAHDHGAMLFVPLLLQILGTKNFYTSNSVDGLPRLVASWLELGSPVSIPIPDIERTHFLLILGANPVVSNGSLMTAPDVKRRLLEIRGRGGKVVVIDPRRTETAEIADEHLFIRPGADAYLLAALVKTVLDAGPPALGRLEDLVQGTDAVSRAVAPFSPERVAPAVGIEAHRIRALAHAFRTAPTAACYGRIGTCTQEFGTLATWLIDVLNAVTGNLDRPGGAMFNTPAADLVGLAASLGKKGGILGFDRWRSRVRGLPEMNGELPVAAMADEIETPGEGRMRALITHAGNPLLSLPNGRRLERALTELELLVSIDIYKNESTRHAHFILPTTFGLEHDHYPLLSNVMAVRNVTKYARALVPRPDGLPDSWALILDLSMRVWSARGAAGRLFAPVAHAILKRIGPRGLIRALLRFGPHGKGLNPLGRGISLDDVEAEPHGIDLGPLEPRLGELVKRMGRKMDLGPAPLISDLARLEARLGDLSRPLDPAALLLIGRRQLRSNNSWMHNSHRLVKGKSRCTLLMHPTDAERRGIQAGTRVRVESKAGAIQVEAELSDEIMPGVVSLPHGWGHDREGAELDVARRHAGASINDLTDDSAIDALSGCTSFSNVAVTVRPG